MRKILIALAVLAALIAACVVWLTVTTGHTQKRVKFPLTSGQRALLRMVPAAATEIAILPTAASLYAKYENHPLTERAIRDWSEREAPPNLAFILGNADAVAWRSGKRIGFAVRPDPLRMWLSRAWLLITGSDMVHEADGILAMNSEEQALSDAQLEPLLAVARTLPVGEAVVIQREASRGAFPPLARPCATSIEGNATDLVLHSRAAAETTDPPMRALPFRDPQKAMLTLAVSTTPPLASELNRLFASHVSSLLDRGGMLVLYRVDARKLVPRPQGVIVLPADAEHRQLFDDFVHSLTSMASAAVTATNRRIGSTELVTREAFGMTLQTADSGSELLLAFDDDSIPAYLGDTLQPFPSGPVLWTSRIDPKQLIPTLNALSDQPGFRLLSPKLHRSGDDLRRWIQYLDRATGIRAEKRTAGAMEELTVTISAK
jgi:hypothetical protein